MVFRVSSLSSCEEYDGCRARVAGVVDHLAFDWAVIAIIFVSLVFVILDVDYAADGEPSPMWLQACNLLLVFAYWGETSAKLYVLRRRFLREKSLILDLVLISVDSCLTFIDFIWGLNVPSGVVRIGRMMKVTRVLRAMRIFPEVNLMMKGIYMAAKSLVWGILVLFMTLCLWSILAVMFIHPLVQELDRDGIWQNAGCERCPRAYASWLNAMLSFGTQFLGEGGFTTINMPIMERYPVTIVFFAPVVLVTVLLVLNFIMGMVMERAMEATKRNDIEESEYKRREFNEFARQLGAMCEQLDKDQDGFVSLEEFIESFRTNKDFGSFMHLMDIDENQLTNVFRMLDTDCDGLLSTSEFVNELHNLRRRESHTLLVFINFYVQEMQKQIARLNGQPGLSHGPTFCQNGDSQPAVWMATPELQTSVLPAPQRTATSLMSNESLRTSNVSFSMQGALEFSMPSKLSGATQQAAVDAQMSQGSTTAAEDMFEAADAGQRNAFSQPPTAYAREPTCKLRAAGPPEGIWIPERFEARFGDDADASKAFPALPAIDAGLQRLVGEMTQELQSLAERQASKLEGFRTWLRVAPCDEPWWPGSGCGTEGIGSSEGRPGRHGEGRAAQRGLGSCPQVDVALRSVGSPAGSQAIVSRM